MRPFLCMWPGMMPILISSGVMTPGQLGPMRMVFLPCILLRVRIMSITGTPSVMHIHEHSLMLPVAARNNCVMCGYRGAASTGLAQRMVFLDLGRLLAERSRVLQHLHFCLAVAEYFVQDLIGMLAQKR